MDSLALNPLHHAWSQDLSDDPYPTQVTTWRDGQLSLNGIGTHFAFIQQGPTQLRCEAGEFQLQTGMYLSVPGPLELSAGAGLIATRLGYAGFFHVGGPAEQCGRLRYIDGCTDSLLIPPVVLGDPCLNLLHLPPHVQQTPHTHPSFRVGLVIDGNGECRTDAGRLPLQPGQVFLIRAGALHSFHTQADCLRIVAYHPDSDFGPTHDNHPMINRTLFDSHPV